jgi:molecular chaperone GrpE
MTKDRKKHDAPATESEPAPAPEDGQTANAAPVDAAAALEDRLLRLQADFDNYRKRMVREREDVWRQARAEVLGEFLSVLDHMDMALASAGQCGAPAALIGGFRLVQDEFMRSLQKFGLGEVDAVGQAFDPAHHEAVAHVHSVEVAENGVIAQTRRGFRIGERLLRPAQVVVSKGPAADVSADSVPGNDGAETPCEGA